MRKHNVVCHVEGEMPHELMQYYVNYYTAAYLEDRLKDSGLSKKEQLAALSEIMECIRSRG